MKKLIKGRPKKKSKKKTNTFIQNLKEKIPFLNKKTKGKKDETKKNKILIGLMYFGIALVGGFLLLMITVIIFSPKFDPDLLYDKESTLLLDIHGDVFASIGAENRELVFYEDLPQVLIDAIISTEDARFFQHGGFDLPRFISASFQQLLGNSAAGGGSTLTMQVSKNTYTDARQVSGIAGLFRKITDIYMSVFQIESNYTKEEIMEFYVNAPWLGSNSWGIEQASRTFFGKSVRDLNLAEASLMAGLFQLPATFNPFVNPDLATKRRATVLNLMVRHGYITEEEKEFANSIPVESMLIPRQESAGHNPNQGFVDTVVEEVIQRTGSNPYSGSMVIETTMDPRIQNVLNDLMAGKLYTYVNDEIQNALAITSVHDGSIVGIANGRNRTGEREFNLATQMNRHPGSTAKPIFGYGPNIEFNEGSSFSLFFDEPYAYTTGQSMFNHDRRYEGLMTSRTALIRSRNITALQVFHDNRPENIAAFARGIGIDFGPTLFEALAVGGHDCMSPLRLSAAYAAFARGGYYIEPYSFTKITFRETGDVFEHKPRRVRAMRPETAAIMNFMLTSAGDADVGGPIRVNGTDVAAKTGTANYAQEALRRFSVPSSAISDSWLGVYSPDYSIGIWYGYEQLQYRRWVTSAQAGPARRAISAAVANRVLRPNSRFTWPNGVVRVEVEMDTFPPMLPSQFTPAGLRTTEMFRRGTEPSEVSWRFSQLNNPTSGSFTASGNTVTLTWDRIPTPNAIDRPFLENHFATFYRQWADKYLGQRLNYNNNHIGTIGYEVYLRNPDGTLTHLGFTTENTFRHNLPRGGDNTFVIRSAYSIFKSNMSSGLEIRTSTSPIGISPEDLPVGDGEPY